MDKPVKVASPARCQLNRENDFFPLLVCAWEFGLARQVRTGYTISYLVPVYHAAVSHMI